MHLVFVCNSTVTSALTGFNAVFPEGLEQCFIQYVDTDLLLVHTSILLDWWAGLLHVCVCVVLWYTYINFT